MRFNNFNKLSRAVPTIRRIAGWSLRAMVGCGLINGGVLVILDGVRRPQGLAWPFRAHPWLLLSIGKLSIFSGVMALFTPLHMLIAGYVLFSPWPRRGPRRRGHRHNGV